MSRYQDEALPPWMTLDGVPGDALVLFAHGAGADMDSDFMTEMSALLVAKGVAVVRFNFAYMEARRVDGKRRPPDRASKLLERFREALDRLQHHFRPKAIFLMGKSMGGRMAAMLAQEQLGDCVNGVMCLGYPFLPLNSAEARLQPLTHCRLPLLIIQGERDKFGNREQVSGWPIPPGVRVSWIPDGDHSFKPRQSSGYSESTNLAAAAEACVAFIGERRE